MKKAFLTTLFLCFSLINWVSIATAASPTPSPTAKPTATPKTTPKATPTPTPQPTDSPDSTTTQKLKERIERVIEEKNEQVKGVIDELAGNRRAFVGEVQRVSAESITVKTTKTTHILALNNSIPLIKNSQKISVDDIAVGDWVIVLGTRDKDDFVPQHIIVSAKTLRPKPKMVTLGTIKSITKTELVVTSRQGDSDKTFVLSKNTSYQDVTGEPIVLKDLEKDLQCLVVGIEGDNGTVQAVVIRSLAGNKSE